jgi:two-component sensor histidine kinase
MSQSVVDPTKTIQFRVTGQAIYLSSQQATACALVINELLQNAVEHGFEQRSKGTVDVALTDDGEWVGIEIYDDGAGLPQEFQLGEDSGLGLRIVRMLVEGDLKGKFEIRGDQTPVSGSEAGVKAVVAFPKTSLGGARN